MKEIINQVQSPFTDEKIQELIEQYIYYDGNNENLQTDIEIVQEIIEESFEYQIYSYTELRVDMIPKAITKYILDNAIEFIEYCNKKQVKMIESIRKDFLKRIKLANYEINELPEENEERKRIESEKKAYEDNINLGHIGFGEHITVVRELLEPLRQYLLDNSERAIPEMIANYRAVCKAHGISEQGVFSLRTEQKINGTQNIEKTLLDLEQELQRLKKQEQRTKQQRDENKLLRNAYKAELEQREQVC